jgi:1-acyl-sn-glycerol-3-phosphate acyltransferase
MKTRIEEKEGLSSFSAYNHCVNEKDTFYRLLHGLSLFISKRYFRAEVRGMNNIPSGPCLLVGNHNCIGVVNPEIWIFGSHYHLQKNLRSLKALGHDFVMRVPLLWRLAQKYLGYVPNNFPTAVKTLRDGHNVLVYPGGGWESCRPSCERDLIDFKQRTGFVKLAREGKVSIVPVVSAGAHDGVFIWKRGSRIAKLLQLHRLFRIDAYPIGFSFPFVFHIGLLPFFPLPRKVLIEILPPIDIDSEKSDAENAERIVASMQSCLTRLASELPRSTHRKHLDVR